MKQRQDTERVGHTTRGEDRGEGARFQALTSVFLYGLRGLRKWRWRMHSTCSDWPRVTTRIGELWWVCARVRAGVDVRAWVSAHGSVCVCFQSHHVQSLESRGLEFSSKLSLWHLGRLFSVWLDRHRRLRWRRQRTQLILQAVRSLWQKNAFMAWQHYVLAVHNQRKEFVLARVLYAWKLMAKREKERRKEARADAEMMQQVDRERATHRNPQMSQPVAPAPVFLPFVDDQKYSDDRSSDESLAPAFSPAASASTTARSPLAAVMGIGPVRTPQGAALSPADLDEDSDVAVRPSAAAVASSPYAALSFRAASLTSLLPPLAAPPLPLHRSLHESLRAMPSAVAAAAPAASSPQWRLTPFRASDASAAAVLSNSLASKLPHAI